MREQPPTGDAVEAEAARPAQRATSTAGRSVRSPPWPGAVSAEAEPGVASVCSYLACHCVLPVNSMSESPVWTRALTHPRLLLGSPCLGAPVTVRGGQHLPPSPPSPRGRCCLSCPRASFPRGGLDWLNGGGELTLPHVHVLAARDRRALVLATGRPEPCRSAAALASLAVALDTDTPSHGQRSAGPGDGERPPGASTHWRRLCPAVVDVFLERPLRVT